MKTHANWIFTAALLALALEGAMGTVGESIAHTMGMNKGMIGVAMATLIGWVWSCFYEPHDPTHHKPPVRTKPRKRPNKSH